MVASSLRPDRASSYNNVLTGADGSVANVEGSATDAEVTGLDDRGHLVHTNHYVCERMLPYEGDPGYADRSKLRYDRGCELLRAAQPGTITMDDLHGMLADHENAPDSICRHPGEDSRTETAFWTVADVTAGVIRFGRGNPCDSITQEYRFVPYAA
jgi:isopenicillin-N N-acyltransferase-like protein